MLIYQKIIIIAESIVSYSTTGSVLEEARPNLVLP